MMLEPSYLQHLKQNDNPDAMVSRAGLMIDTDEPCCPDGLVELSGTDEPREVVELKCPYT